MEEQSETQSCFGHDNGCDARREREQHQQIDEQDQHVLEFMDSMDAYITLFDSLSSTLRQGWMDIASARHSMGVSRVNSALFDLKVHPAATSVKVTLDEDSPTKLSEFTLYKWAYPDDGQCCYEERKYNDNELMKKSKSLQLRHRGTSMISESQEVSTGNNGAPVAVVDKFQMERSKSLSVFGTLVSPKLRSAQVSFETALEILVQIATIRSSMLCAHDHVCKDMEGPKD